MVIRKKIVGFRFLYGDLSLLFLRMYYQVIRQITGRAIRKLNGSLKRAADDASLAAIDSLTQRIEAVPENQLYVIFRYLQQPNSSVLKLVLSLFLNEDELKTALSVVKKAPMPLKNTQYISPVPTDRMCPKCGAPLLIITANKGAKAGMKFIGCSGFKKTCDYVEQLERMEK